MGAYLSEPITKKISSDESGTSVAFGASSMQGWRVSQEDAHNCCINFDEDTSLFAVYDGHGGHEVATYCSKELPGFIKNTETYKAGDIRQGLIDAFLNFDATLTKPNIVALLKEIASSGKKEKIGNWESDEEESVSNLRMEAAMPLEQVIANYHRAESTDSPLKDFKDDTTDKTISDPSNPYLRRQRRRNKDKSGIGEEGHCSTEPSCSSSSSSWKADEQPCTSSAPVKTEDTKTSNGSVDVTKSESDTAADNKSSVETVDSTENAKDQKPEVDSPVKILGENTSSGCSSGPLENGQIKKESGVSSRRRITPKHCTRGYRIRLPKDASYKDNNCHTFNFNCADDDDDDDDEDDDNDDDDETFDGLPYASSDDDDHVVEGCHFYKDDSSSSAGGCGSTSSENEGNDSAKKERCVEDDDDEEEDDDDDDDDDEDDEEEEEDDDDDGGNFSMSMTEEPGSDSGCTAVVAILHSRELYVANAGDSRCVLCRDGQAVELSLDHKPEDEPELERITKAGGKVTGDGRVNGGLNLSRALGDHAYKQNTTLPPQEQMISALPDVRHVTLEPGRDEFMILACDGIWNFMSSQEVVGFIRPRLANLKSSNISIICEELFDMCLAPTTHGDGTGCDNMTAVIVKFNWNNEKPTEKIDNCVSIEISQTNQTKKRPISPAKHLETKSTDNDKESTSNDDKAEKNNIDDSDSTTTVSTNDTATVEDSCKRLKSENV